MGRACPSPSGHPEGAGCPRAPQTGEEALPWAPAKKWAGPEALGCASFPSPSRAEETGPPLVSTESLGWIMIVSECVFISMDLLLRAKFGPNYPC